jgi:hypothetical protein
MYRYIVDNAMTYTPDDLVLFRESPFAVWMERLTVENPDHGIPPDLESLSTYPQSPQQDDIVATLRSEGRNVALIDSDEAEPDRRVATLEAMRLGADFIVNGQLAFGTLSGTVDLLMRTSGFSELGDFLYIPCETRVDNSLQSPFRLCFAADLLATLQGQLPAQMLIIRNGAEVVPLQTEDHIHYYRAVQRRFFRAMHNFRKHRMPDPSESAHFGRWAECASEVLKQRAASEPHLEREPVQDAPEEVVPVPQLRVASGAGAGSQYDMDVAGQTEFATSAARGDTSASMETAGERGSAGVTLAEQARMLKPGSYGNGKPPGHTPSLARIGIKPRAVATPVPAESPAEPAAEEHVKPSVEPIMKAPDMAPKTANHTVRSAPEDALDNLEFIGSGPANIRDDNAYDADIGEAIARAPAPNLRHTPTRDVDNALDGSSSDVVSLREREPRPPVFLPPDEEPDHHPEHEVAMSAPREQLSTHSHDSADPESDESDSVIDLDSAPSSGLAPVVQRAEQVFKRFIRDDPMFKKPEAEKPADTATFSSSLQTSEEFDEN